jgi:hypothetical protein
LVSGKLKAEQCVTRAVEAFGTSTSSAATLACSQKPECQDYPVENFDYIIRRNIRTARRMSCRDIVIASGSEAGEVGEATAAPFGGTDGSSVAHSMTSPSRAHRQPHL